MLSHLWISWGHLGIQYLGSCATCGCDLLPKLRANRTRQSSATTPEENFKEGNIRPDDNQGFQSSQRAVMRCFLRMREITPHPAPLALDLVPSSLNQLQSVRNILLVGRFDQDVGLLSCHWASRARASITQNNAQAQLTFKDIPTYRI